jgi:iron complex transport system substrate-binding protein
MRLLLSMLLLCLAGAAQAAEVKDATGRSVDVPEHVARVLPAGVPAEVLLTALAPDLMLGVVHPLSAEARAALWPEAARLPQVPRLTGRQDVSDAVRKLHPDLIVDYGDVTPGYIALAKSTEAKLGVPVLLFDGALDRVPATLRTLGAVLHREARAETLARLAEAMLALPEPAAKRRVVYVRGRDRLLAIAPGTGVAEVFTRLGWTVLAPAGTATFRPVTVAEVAKLDPDEVVFADAGMRAVVAGSAEWKAVRAVREGNAFIAPALPFGWVEEPPSINRLLGLAWLGGHDAATLAAMFDAVVYGHAPSAAELAAVAESVRAVP